MDKRRFTTAVGKYLINPIVKAAIALRLAPPSYAILETTGRKSGQPRRTPVGNGLDGNTFWLVAEHGHRAHYVRNIEANPRVRLKVLGTWHSGTAHALPHDDPGSACGRSACASTALSCRSWAPNCSRSGSILIPTRLVTGLSCLAWDGV
jgi:deazaflavin-dependent oxidoreductase (nitroreductase family)